MPETPTTAKILHVFTSAESASDATAKAIVATQQKARGADSVSTLVLTAENGKEALDSIFAADHITTWPGVKQ